VHQVVNQYVDMTKLLFAFGNFAKAPKKGGGRNFASWFWFRMAKKN